MSNQQLAPAVPNANELHAEAANVERLRRQIAEFSAKGQPASPQMLADFARVQKAYLDRKIVFERTKRLESGLLAPPAVAQSAPVAEVKIEPVQPVVEPPPKPPVAPTPNDRVPPQPVTPQNTRPKVTETPSSMASVPSAPPKRSSDLIWIVAAILGVAAAIAWWMLR